MAAWSKRLPSVDTAVFDGVVLQVRINCCCSLRCAFRCCSYSSRVSHEQLCEVSLRKCCKASFHFGEWAKPITNRNRTLRTRCSNSAHLSTWNWTQIITSGATRSCGTCTTLRPWLSITTLEGLWPTAASEPRLTLGFWRTCCFWKFDK